MVEATFRSMEAVLGAGPIYDQRGDPVRGLVFCSFLALVLRQELQPRLAAKTWSIEWGHFLRDRESFHETTITTEERASLVRSEAKRTAGKVFQAYGIALAPTLRSINATAASATPQGGRVTTRLRSPQVSADAGLHF